MTALTVLVLASLAAGQAPATSLGQRYTDPIQGFSIRPPAGCEIVRDPSTTELVSFNLRDLGTGAIQVSLKVLKAAEYMEERIALLERPDATPQQRAADLLEYGQNLAAQMAIDQQYHVDESALRTLAVAGLPALNIEGTLGSPAQMYVRQVWVHRPWAQGQPSSFFVLRASGPSDDADRVRSVLEASMATLELHDPTATREQLHLDLEAGRALLEQLTVERLAAAAAPEEYWLGIQHDGRLIGFSRYQEQPFSALNSAGVLVVSDLVVMPPGGPVSLSKREMYASHDVEAERWERYELTRSSDGGERVHHEFAIKQRNVLLLQTVIDLHNTENQQRRLPAGGFYLPQAFSPLLPRLVDRSRPGQSYAFAMYNPASGGIDMRTIKVVGPRTIAVSGQSFQATLLEDRMAQDAPVVQVYVDEAGLPLQIVSEDGTTIQRTTGEALRARFPREWQEIRQLGQGRPRQPNPAPAPRAGTR